MPASTFSSLLSDQLRMDPARPLVTFYDDATGERVELSVTTFSNWVSKTAGLAQDELDLERGALVLVNLPTHWLGAVWLGAAWTAGLCVTTDPTLGEVADLVVCGPDGVAGYADRVDAHPVVAISLRPLGARFADPLPTGVTDYGAVVLAQPDAFVSMDPPGSDDLAWRDGDRSISQGDVLESARDAPVIDPQGRLLTDVNPCSEQGLRALVSPLLQGGATVWVANA
ncbi:MAG: TIGR03089 family protein, partial [Pseudonocardia sp.]